jgi:hypothetical protein
MGNPVDERPCLFLYLFLLGQENHISTSTAAELISHVICIQKPCRRGRATWCRRLVLSFALMDLSAAALQGRGGKVWNMEEASGGDGGRTLCGLYQLNCSYCSIPVPSGTVELM